MTWFEELTGIPEKTPNQVRKNLEVDGLHLRSRKNGRSWRCGKLETPTLAQLREQAVAVTGKPKRNKVREVVADVQRLHADKRNAHALFQVASQFNLLEMASPEITPERGVGIYELDHTQGPACAIAAGAGTIFRNYFVDVNGRIGQSDDNQIDCLADIGERLGNSNQDLWKMVNGYAIPSTTGLKKIDQKLQSLDEHDRDQLRQTLRIGTHWDTQVTLDDSTHVVSQAYCSAMPVAYTQQPAKRWERFATLVLEASYEATFCAAIINANRTKNTKLFLTLLGGGVFGNETTWITHALRRSLSKYHDCGLDIAVVSYGHSNPIVQQLVDEFV